ncbi:helix-turn-helix domain-containing protein [Clostridium cellulovorans]|nr:helix-turn-helix domain-containing protein [Clostridium cellulovorans]
MSVKLQSVKSYPLHWHNCLEILFVLKGRFFVQIESEIYELCEREIEIINADEPHRVYSEDEDNLILVFKIHLDFFEKYFNDVKNIYFYTNSSDEGIQEEDKYQELRKFLAILACEAVQQEEDYDEEVEEQLVKLLFHLLNNFHYLTYDEEVAIENQVQFQRYHRITKYIHDNYMNKISLQDIASREFLSSYYLSHEIKNMAGTNFIDFLNTTRVNESIKFLLDSDKTISDISEEVGFSHTRYYNKYFKQLYNITPLQYRKKYYLSEDLYEKTKEYSLCNLEKALEYLSVYLEDYDRFNYKKQIIKIYADLKKEAEAFPKVWSEVINLGDAIELLKEKEQGFVKNIQSNMKFNYGIVQYLFHKDMRVYFNEKLEFLNWNEVEKLMEFLLDIDMKPIIILDRELESKDMFIKLIESFILYFSDLYGIEEIQGWRFRVATNLPEEFIEATDEILEKYQLQNIIRDSFEEDTTVRGIFDSAYMVPYIIHNFIHSQNDMLFLKAYDTVEENSIMSNELFFGAPGIMTLHGIRKASYYAYYFLSRLGAMLIEKGEGYVITKNEEDYQILLYSYTEDLDNLITIENLSKEKGKKNLTERQISLTLRNLPQDYKITSYEIGEDIGSAYNNWIAMGRPRRLSDEELDVLHRISFPRISLNFTKKKPIFNILNTINGYGAVLITLQKVQKHLY